MSRQARQQGVWCTTATCLIAALVSVHVRAADPNIPTDPNVSAGRQQAETARTTALPRPRRPAGGGRSSLTRQTSFGDAIEILRNSTRPALNIVVLWKEIGENAGVYRETPIGFDGPPGLRVRQYLDLLVTSLSAGASAKLGYVVRSGVVIIGTTDALPVSPNVTRVYDVSDLVAPPARYFNPWIGMGAMGYGNMYGGQMMGPTGGYGGYGGGYGTGMLGVPGGSYGYGGAGNLSGFLGGLYGGTGRSPAPYIGR